MRHAVLLVDDERFARTVYADYLRAAGYDVEVAQDAEAALNVLRQRRFDVLLTDVILPGSSGLDLLAAAKQLDPALEVAVITALDRVDPAVRAMKSGASDYLVKPVTPEQLQLAVQRCLSTRALLAENKTLRAHLELFEAGQRIAATLDRDKLVPMALETVARSCRTAAAVLMERTEESGWILSGAHGIDCQAAADLLALCEPTLQRLAPDSTARVELTPGDLVALAPRAVLLPVTADDGELVGAAAVLVAGELDVPGAEAAAFLCRNLGLALRNLGRLKQVEHLAYLDDLTHLYNTRYLDVALDRELSGGRPFSILFLDLDHFKSVNDQHGHLAGSRVLVEVGRVLRSCVRDEDVLVRYGGDEYVVVLTGTDSGGGLKVAERIRRAVEDHRFLSREGSRVRITASIGLASFPEHAGGKSEILDLADRAMYRGKQSTRNVVYIASKDLPPVPAGERGS
jgi:two-component system, cell cycle response regulator